MSQDAPSLLAQVCEAQYRNSTLGGSELRQAGATVAAIARTRRLELLAADEAGERIIGAAIMNDDNIWATDASSRLDGRSVLLVAGYLAGATGIASKSGLARALGAEHVELAFLGLDDLRISGCERVTHIRPDGEPVAG